MLCLLTLLCLPLFAMACFPWGPAYDYPYPTRYYLVTDHRCPEHCRTQPHPAPGGAETR
jgi:hypothetical protein